MSAAFTAPPAGGVHGSTREAGRGEAGTSRCAVQARATLAGGGSELPAPGRFFDIDDWLSAHGGATREPDWGPLQAEWRVLRDHGYSMARRPGGSILVDGHRMNTAGVRRLAAKLLAGATRWQGNGRAA